MQLQQQQLPNSPACLPSLLLSLFCHHSRYVSLSCYVLVPGRASHTHTHMRTVGGGVGIGVSWLVGANESAATSS